MNARDRCLGFTLVSAIFLLVVLAALGAAIALVSTTEQIGSALDVQGARAYQAARAGIEWGLYKLQSSTNYNFSYGPSSGAVGTADPNTRACPAASSSFVPGASTLAGFTVTVTCSAHTDAHGGPTVYELRSTACNQPSAGSCPNSSPGSNYVERSVEVLL